MGRSTMLAGVALAAVACMACGGGSMPMSPSSTMQPAMTGAGVGQPGMPAAGEAAAAPVGLTGVIRRLDVQGRTFAVQTRTATYTVRADDRTEVWKQGAQVRFSSLSVGQVVTIRGYDYSQYVLARTIGVS